MGKKDEVCVREEGRDQEAGTGRGLYTSGGEGCDGLKKKKKVVGLGAKNLIENFNFSAGPSAGRLEGGETQCRRGTCQGELGPI